LTQALTDEILFYMEDQNGEFLLDTCEGIILNADDEGLTDKAGDGEDSRYLFLPEWGPPEGFRLMEHFTASLRNPLVREELSAALNRGRGVFRAFKNTLSRYPEAEKRWFGFKDREMKREVIGWYNALRESWGLDLIGEEPEDIAGLVLEDFRFREGTADDLPAAEELRRFCLCERLDGAEAASAGIEILAGMGEWVFPGEISFVAETSGGEFAGYICAAVDGSIGAASAGGGLPLRICAIEVRPEYRGLGLGKTLITRLLEQADSRNLSRILVDLPAGLDHFSRVLLREYFRPCVQRYCRSSSKKEPETGS